MLLLALPFVATAELTSTNFVVTGEGFASGGFSANASSTNYQNDSESGPIFVYDVATSTSGGGGGGGTTTNPPAATSTPPASTSTPPTTTPPPTNPPSTTAPGGGSTGTSGGGGTNTSPEQNNPEATSSRPMVTPLEPAQTEQTVPTTTPDTNQGVAPPESTTIATYVREVSDGVKMITKQLLEPLTPYIEPLVSVAKSDIGVRSSIGSGLFLTAFSFGRVPLSLTNLYRSLYHVWSNFIGFVVFWKRRRAWGTVYDSETKAPLDPAYVELFDEHDQKVAEAITDLDGRYGFVVDPGLYSLRVRKTNYTFPSRKYSLRDPDVLYSHLYFGGDIEITDAITSDIPMDPQSFDWNQYEKMRTKQTTFIHRFDPLIVRLLNLLFYIGAVVAAWQAFASPTVFTVALFLLYVVLLVLKVGTGGPVLYGHISQAGKSLPFVVVRAMQNGRVVKSAVSDSFGRYCVLVHPGTYQIQLEAHQADDTYTVIYTGVVKAKHGVINQNLSV